MADPQLDTGVNVIENDHAMKFILRKYAIPHHIFSSFQLWIRLNALAIAENLHATMDCAFDTRMTSTAKSILCSQIKFKKQCKNDSCTTQHRMFTRKLMRRA